MNGHDVGPGIIVPLMIGVGLVILSLLFLSVDLRHQTTPTPAPHVVTITPATYPAPGPTGGVR